jgi:hypothetical protein
METHLTNWRDMSTLKRRQRSAPDSKKLTNIVSFSASQEDIQTMTKAMKRLNLTRGELLRKSFYNYIEKAI